MVTDGLQFIYLIGCLIVCLVVYLVVYLVYVK